MPTRFEEVANYLVIMQNKAQDICHSSPYPEDDIRHRGFLHVLGVIQPLIIIWNILLAVDRNKVPDQYYMPLFGMKKEWVPQQFGTLEIFEGISLIIQLHFGLEVFLKNILSKIETPIPTKFYQIAHKLLEKISISEKEKKYLTLMALTHIRNGYHSNGIHLNKSTKAIFIQNLKFEFIRGQSYECATPKHVCVLVNEIISIMEKITLAKEVKRIKEKIPDQYIPDDIESQ